MLLKTPIGALIREATLEPADILLDAREATYVTRRLGLPETHDTANLLPVRVRHWDVHAHPGEQPLDDEEWAQSSDKVPGRLDQI